MKLQGSMQHHLKPPEISSVMHIDWFLKKLSAHLSCLWLAEFLPEHQKNWFVWIAGVFRFVGFILWQIVCKLHHFVLLWWDGAKIHAPRRWCNVFENLRYHLYYMNKDSQIFLNMFLLSFFEIWKQISNSYLDINKYSLLYGLYDEAVVSSDLKNYNESSMVPKRASYARPFERQSTGSSSNGWDWVKNRLL